MTKLSDWDVNDCRDCYYRRTHESGRAYCGKFYDENLPMGGCEWGARIQKMGGRSKE